MDRIEWTKTIERWLRQTPSPWTGTVYLLYILLCAMCLPTRIHAEIREVHASTHACMHAYMQTLFRMQTTATHIHACISQTMRLIYLHGCMHVTCLQTYIDTCTHAAMACNNTCIIHDTQCMQMQAHACMHACTCGLTHTHACTRRRMNTQKHTAHTENTTEPSGPHLEKQCAGIQEDHACHHDVKGLPRNCSLELLEALCLSPLGKQPAHIQNREWTFKTLRRCQCQRAAPEALSGTS
jgi:hypothetical protein